MATVEFHVETSRAFLEQAEDEFSKGDTLQAAEKGWGAAAHAVKAVAERRGWRHETHADLFQASGTLTNEMSLPRIGELFRLVSTLHTHFYEGLADRRAGRARIGRGEGWGSGDEQPYFHKSRGAE